MCGWTRTRAPGPRWRPASPPPHARASPADPLRITAPADISTPDPGLAALCRLFAERRADVIAAAVSGPMDEAGRAWVRDAVDSLHRLARHAGRPVRLGDDGDLTAVRLAEVRDLLRRDPAPVAGRMPLACLVDAATADARAASVERGVTASIDVQIPAGVEVSRDVAGAVVDALGRVMRDAVVFCGSEGVAIRLVGHTERDMLVIVVGDRGRAGAMAADATITPARQAGLHAAGGCIAAAGGDLVAGVGSWGGVSVTLRAPLD